MGGKPRQRGVIDSGRIISFRPMTEREAALAAPVKPLWPPEKPIPDFATIEEEERFWTSYEFEDGDASDWEEIEGPGAERHGVYRFTPRSKK